MPVTTTHSFGVLLKQLRKRAGMTQRDLAAALNYSDSLISSLEHAQRLPDLHAVMTRFIPALGLQDDPTTATRLIEQAALACGERPGDLVTLHHATHAMLQDESAARAVQLLSSPDELIGRAEEVQQVCNRLRGHSGRLLTLVGPPGIGKTRLALAVAARMHRHYPDGAVFVPLAAITDPTVMASTIAVAVGSNNASAKPPTMRLIEALRHRSMLLVLDNCEQLIGASPLVAEVLAACPGLCVLATSRERLHLRAEQRYRVPPLDLAAAVDLFAQRAAAVDADFAVTAANRSTIEAICQRLDRLPLAIELCAAQVDLLAPSQILTQLHAHPLDLLVDGAHDLPSQHRTLRTAIQRSYDLLADDERVLFRRLGVFLGGCDLAAVETVCAWQAETPTRSLLATLHGLVGKSLVRVEPTLTGESRFLLLETLREFALEQLRVQGEEHMLRERHYAAYLELVRTADSYLRTPEAAPWLARLHPEQDNIRAALHWTLDAQRYTDTAWLLIAVDWYWFHNGQWYEAGQWLAQLLPHRMILDIDLRLAFMLHLYSAARSFEAFQPLERWNAEMLQLLDASANMHLHAYAWQQIGLTYYATDYPRAVAGFERAIACARAAATALELDARYCWFTDHGHLLGNQLWAYANALVNQGEFEQALPLLLESRDIFQQRGSRYEMSYSLGTLGLLALLQGDLARAYAQLHEAVTIATEFNYQMMIGFWQPVLGLVTLYSGDVAGARRILTASLHLCTELKDPMLLARTLTALAETALWEGQIDEAAHWLTQSLAHADPGIIIYEVVRLFVAARVATAQGQYQRAAMLFGLAEQVNSQIHRAYAGPLCAPADIALATVRAALSPDVFAEAFAAGQQLSLSEAFATILHPAAIAA